MAIPVNIDNLINRRVVESSRIEYKADFNPAPVIRSICAFANDIDNMGGGYIILGVEDNNGAPVFPIKGIPQERIDGILKKLREYCHFIEPLYEPVVEPVLYQDVYVIIIWAAGGYGRPYKAPREVTVKFSPKQYFIRKFSSTAAASPEEEKELFYASSNIPFDDRPNLAASVDDLDIGLLRSHLKEIGSSLYQHALSMDALQIARNMQLIDGPEESLKPRNVGILMFSETPEKYFRYARIEVVDIPDPTGTDMVEKTFNGPIQRQLKDALSYLKNYAVKEVVIKTPEKAEAVRISNYPYAAIEEILANAVYHRSYQVNEPVTVRIMPDGIEVTSFPGFDRSITDAAILTQEIRARIYRNRRIGDFLKELKLIEGRNTGFPNAKKALQENGSPQLRFDMNPERDYLSVTIPVHPYFLKTRFGEKGATSAKEAAHTNEAAYAKETAYADRITSCLKAENMTLTELAKAMGYKGISARLRRAVTELKETGAITQVVEENAVKYTV